MINVIGSVWLGEVLRLRDTLQRALLPLSGLSVYAYRMITRRALLPALLVIAGGRYPVRDYASAVGVGGSDCVATARKRGRLGLDLVGADATSVSTSGFD